MHIVLVEPSKEIQQAAGLGGDIEEVICDSVSRPSSLTINLPKGVRGLHLVLSTSRRFRDGDSRLGLKPARPGLEETDGEALEHEEMGPTAHRLAGIFTR